MTAQDRYIPGVPCWIDTEQPDVDAAVEFYRGLFGWQLEDVMPPGPYRYVMARIAGGVVAAIGTPPQDAMPGDPAWNTYVRVRSADETAAKVRAAGGRVLMTPADAGEAGRMAVFADPEGAAFRVWEARATQGADVVNEPGALNFNDLNTRDPETASAFYGAVFGWERLDVGDGAMWALPGYGDFLEQRTPGMRASMAEMGAPERFEDVVASLSAIPADQPDRPPHWGVTFAVEDADATAARAQELGGTIAVAPFDALWVRMAVITDPQGATFIASKFVPENKDLEAGAGAATG